MSEVHNVVVQLLGSIDSQKEVRQYLQHYASMDEQRFAVVKVGGGIVADKLDALAETLSFLHHVRLYPIVVHGGGPQLSAALAARGIPAVFEDGLRVTTPEVLQVARKVFLDVNLQLVDALVARGTHARPITSGILSATLSKDSRLGMVGDVDAVDIEPLSRCIASGYLPVIAPLGETQTGQIVNVNADVVARAIAKAVKPHKIVFLTETGGLLDEDGRIISAINLATDLDRLLKADWVQGGMRRKLQEIAALLHELPDSSSVSITAPSKLTRELFTHQGAGTLVQRGEKIQRFDSFKDVDTGRVRALLERCFDKRLSEDYFESKKPKAIYLAESMRAVAIVTDDDIPYLDKFAVTDKAQGVGLGASLWRMLQKDHPRLYWRARVHNPVNDWYFRNAAGAVRGKEWVVFWTGTDDFGAIQKLVTRARSLPATLFEGAS